MKHTTFTTARASGPISEIDFCTWLGHAMPGERFEYHRGFLLLDIAPSASRLADAHRRVLRRLARRAMQFSADGLVHLVQERLAPNHFAYIAIARQKPRHRPIPLPSLLREDNT